ncbi:MAG: hypothetical protein VX341_02350, partial [Bdellovibrionota bacterium]|nr:hypothetical protein [Bdellovibrionota bacterium]
PINEKYCRGNESSFGIITQPKGWTYLRCINPDNGNAVNEKYCTDKVSDFGVIVQSSGGYISCINPRTGINLDMKYCEKSKSSFGMIGYDSGGRPKCINPHNGYQLDKDYCLNVDQSKGRLTQRGDDIVCINSIGAPIGMVSCADDVGGFGKLVAYGNEVICVNPRAESKIDMKYCEDESPHFGYVRYNEKSDEVLCIDIVENVLIDLKFCRAKLPTEILSSIVTQNNNENEIGLNDNNRFQDIKNNDLTKDSSQSTSVGK